MSTIETNVVKKSFLTRMSVDSYFIIAFIIIISPFLLIFFRTYLSLCERLSRLCHVPRAATLTTICSFFAKCAATGGKRNSQNVPTSTISVDLQAIDNRLEQLKSASLQSTSRSVRFAQSSENSWHPFRTLKPSFQQALRILIVSWPGTTGMVKR